MTHTIKPIHVNFNYMSPEDAIKLIEQTPIEGNGVPELPLNLDLENKIIEMDLNSKKADEIMWLSQWIPIYNEDNKILASMSDYYNFFKQIKNNKSKNKNSELIQSLKNDILTRGILTSTVISYDFKLKGQITHHYGSKLINETTSELLIPECNDTLIDMACLQSNEGLRFVQTLFKTYDSPDAIIKTFDYVLGTNKNVFISTPNESIRDNSTPKPFPRNTYLTIKKDYLLINCELITLPKDGLVRGVTYK